jgi:hypothetical protein
MRLVAVGTVVVGTACVECDSDSVGIVCCVLHMSVVIMMVSKVMWCSSCIE